MEPWGFKGETAPLNVCSLCTARKKLHRQQHAVAAEAEEECWNAIYLLVKSCYAKSLALFIHTQLPSTIRVCVE